MHSRREERREEKPSATGNGVSLVIHLMAQLGDWATVETLKRGSIISSISRPLALALNKKWPGQANSRPRLGKCNLPSNHPPTFFFFFFFF